MAPAAAASTLSATSAAAADASKRPAASDAEPIGSPVLHHQDGDEAARKHHPRQQQQQLECPRCQSTNTKFCYYNNYSTAQPRHFCRACRRYWTHGGTLRDVPVGGASRRAAKRRRVDADAEPSPPQTTARAEDGYRLMPDLSAFPFLSDGIFLPQLDLGAAPAATFSSWHHSGVPDFYDGLAPWDDGTAGVTGAWGDIAGLELSWPPPGN